MLLYKNLQIVAVGGFSICAVRIWATPNRDCKPNVLKHLNETPKLKQIAQLPEEKKSSWKHRCAQSRRSFSAVVQSPCPAQQMQQPGRGSNAERKWTTSKCRFFDAKSKVLSPQNGCSWAPASTRKRTISRGLPPLPREIWISTSRDQKAHEIPMSLCSCQSQRSFSFLLSKIYIGPCLNHRANNI